MATLTITVNDAIIPRLQAAYGVSTNPQLKAAIIADIKHKVVEYEVAAADLAASTAVSTAIADKATALETAKTNAESQIALS